MKYSLSLIVIGMFLILFGNYFILFNCAPNILDFNPCKTEKVETKLNLKNSIQTQTNNQNKNKNNQPPPTTQSQPNKKQEGWMRISSSSFEDAKLHHLMQIIKIDHEQPFKGFFFRMNEKFPQSGIPDKWSFYFRISPNLLYYSEIQEGMIILDSIHLADVKVESGSDIAQNCFSLHDGNLVRKWDLCPKTLQEKIDWICAIQHARGLPCSVPEGRHRTHQIQLIKRKILRQPVIIIPIPSPFCNEKWDYHANGDDWICECKEGKSQSPVNIPVQTIKFEKRALFDFFMVNLNPSDEKLQMVYEDHILKIKANFGRLITYDLIKYEAYEMQFHTRSEHSIHGEFFDLEVQVYFRSTSRGYARKSAALSILFKISPLAENKFFSHDINFLDLPDSLHKSKTLDKPIDVRHLFIQNKDDTYQGFSYFQYEGSLTSPPCQEETTWFVVSNPLPISFTIVEYFKDSFKIINGDKCDALSENENLVQNYRNTQLLNGRLVYFFEDCFKPKKLIIEPKGHYEKVKQELTKYFYVNNDKPTGIPGAFVVGEKEVKMLLE